MSKSGANSMDWSLCWDCRNATRPMVCSWARDFTPVKGWKATPTRIGNYCPYESYLVRECPLFQRGSYKGGLVEDSFSPKEPPTELDNKDMKNLACVIIERAVDDWKALDYGKLKDLYHVGGRAKRKELMEFFWSYTFDDMVEAAGLSVTVEQIYNALKITPQLAKEILTSKE